MANQSFDEYVEFASGLTAGDITPTIKGQSRDGKPVFTIDLPTKNEVDAYQTALAQTQMRHPDFELSRFHIKGDKGHSVDFKIASLPQDNEGAWKTFAHFYRYNLHTKKDQVGEYTYKVSGKRYDDLRSSRSSARTRYRYHEKECPMERILDAPEILVKEVTTFAHRTFRAIGNLF